MRGKLRINDWPLLINGLYLKAIMMEVLVDTQVALVQAKTGLAYHIPVWKLPRLPGPTWQRRIISLSTVLSAFLVLG